MIKEIYKKSLPVVFSLLTLTSCDKEVLENNVLKMKQFLQVPSQNLADEIKPEYDDSMLNKWYKIQDKKDLAERMLGSSNYETYDIVVPFPGGKWTRTAFVPIIEEALHDTEIAYEVVKLYLNSLFRFLFFIS